MPPPRPFYKRKRWIAAGVLWLVVPAAYLGSFGPAAYCVGRGWMGHYRFEDIYRPLTKASKRVGLLGSLADYYYACRDQGVSDSSL